jgi:molybdate transport system substrate-binding protein
MEQKVLSVLSGGAAQAVVTALAEPFRAQTGYEIRGEFGAVGAMKEKLLRGFAADLVILTRSVVDGLATHGQVVAASRADLGTARTGIAVKQNEPPPAVGTAAELRETLRAARGLYLPDPERATAGIHFVNVLKLLGIHADVASRLRPYPNGNTAMRELAQAKETGLIGCTQVTEIRATPGVVLVDALPPPFHLATVYTAAVCARSKEPDAAARFVALLTGEASRAQRERAGFEV